MNHLEIFFEINKNEKIVIHSEENLVSADSCAECLAFLLIDGKQYTIFYDFISYTLQTLIYFLEQAIAHKLKLHKSITNDLGYLWIQGLQKRPGLSYVEIENVKRWVGLQNLLWSTQSNKNPVLDTWIYNKEDSIILEITPCYPWHFYNKKEAKKYKDYVFYEEWIKNYKPLLIRAIPKDVAEQWLNQAQEILKKIEENSARLHTQETIEEAT